ncbi:MAG: acetyl-CoA C-acyltransferase [Saprospiraceae bacterium]|nr:acetyl-CoA C-acyltransferase [Saprospiraceae bacterium]MCB9318352.1 acetyl-CoA C-acyltransferase [Lewinellaceae bacterium]
MRPSFLVGGVRTPIGKFGGTLSTVRADDLAAGVIRHLVDRYGRIPFEEYDDVLLGCANQAGEDNRNVARMALLLAGLPWSVPGETINRLCASGMSAVIHAHHAITNSDADLLIAGGVEHMTRAPWVLSKSAMPFGRDVELFDSSFGWRFINPNMHERFGTDSMGATAENLAQAYHISREAQDAFALSSQIKASAADASGRLAEEIVSVEIPRRKADPLLFEKDEFIKPQTTLEGLSKLNPAFLTAAEGGTVTAGNSSGLNDGAIALLIASEDAVHRHQLEPLARIVASSVVGVEPRMMGIGPVPATRKLLAKTGLTLGDMDIIEINEAFAVQVLACLQELGLPQDDPRINPNGGAIALGHPLGMTGARILLTAALELANQMKRYALVTMCVGVGQGYAVLLERS